MSLGFARDVEMETGVVGLKGERLVMVVLCFLRKKRRRDEEEEEEERERRDKTGEH